MSTVQPDRQVTAAWNIAKLMHDQLGVEMDIALHQGFKTVERYADCDLEEEYK